MMYQDFYGYLLREEAYDAGELNCFAFCHGSDVKQGLVLSLGNMVSGYGFELDGVHFNNSECAYIAGAFSSASPLYVALQRQLAGCDNGFMAKKGIRKAHEADMRADWLQFNVAWMVYVVWHKCIGNEAFARLLLSYPDDAVIIEDSTFQHGPTATFWGTSNAELRIRQMSLRKSLRSQGLSKAAVKRELNRHRLGDWSTEGVFVGRNVMGKILMACKSALAHGIEPPIDYALLRGHDIHLLGLPLSFVHSTTPCSAIRA